MLLLLLARKWDEASLTEVCGHLAQFLLECGVGTEGLNSEGQSPLMVAACHGLVDATKVTARFKKKGCCLLSAAPKE